MLSNARWLSSARKRPAWMFLGIGLCGVLVTSGSLAQAKLYHPELLTLGMTRQSLIDCEHGFGPALLDYFTHFAQQDGVPVSGVPKITKLDRESDKWISRFELSDGSHTFRGIVYVEPPADDGDDGDLPPMMMPPRARMCSAAFVQGTPTTAEQKQLTDAYLSLSGHFGVAP